MTDFIENAGHVPDFIKNDITWEKLTYSQNSHSLTVNVPILTPVQCDQLARHIKDNSRQFLKKQTVDSIIYRRGNKGKRLKWWLLVKTSSV